MSSIETPKTPTKLSCVPSKVNSPNKENFSSPLKGLGLSSMSLNYSGTLTTSYTPDARLRKMVDSPKSCYGTPKSVLSERNVSLHYMRVEESSTPLRAATRTLQEVRKTMHLIDLTTPQVSKTPKSSVRPAAQLTSDRKTPQSSTPKAKKRNLIDLTTPESYRTPVGQKTGSLLKSALKNTAGRTPIAQKKPMFSLDDPSNVPSTSKVTGSPKVPVKRHSCVSNATSTPISSRTLMLRTPKSQNKPLNPISEGKAKLIVQTIEETPVQVDLKTPSSIESGILKRSVEITQSTVRRVIKLGKPKDDFEGIQPLETLSKVEGIELLQKPDAEAPESVEEAEPTVEIEEPAISADQAFDALAGNPIIKHTYSRRSNSLSPVKVAQDPVVKPDIGEWIDSVQATTSAPKTPTTVQVLSSRYSNVTPHEQAAEPSDAEVPTPQLDKSVIAFKKVYTTLKTPRTPEATTAAVNRLSLTPLNRMSISSVGHVDESEPATTSTTPLLQKSMRSTRKRIGSAFMFLNTSNFNENSFNASICSENVDGEGDTVGEEQLNGTFTVTEGGGEQVEQESDENEEVIEDLEVLAEVLPEDQPEESKEGAVEPVIEAGEHTDSVEIPGKLESFFVFTGDFFK
jgi:hypothetical protein